MDPLRQRLKELDPHTFEDLCFHVLKERHPGLRLVHVDGSGGDEGLDVFAGDLYGRPTIWQSKSFPNGVRESQKEQIRNSLKTALKRFTPAHWILCLSVDMDAKSIRWFERWKKSHSSGVQIGLFSASDIVHELFHRRSIRNHYFPGAALDPVELKRIIAKSGELRLEELERITENNLEDYIERLKERDARFNYQIVFDGDLGPRRSADVPAPGLMFSISTGAKTVNVFARDVDALRSNPPKLEFSLSEAGLAKYRELIRTGSQQEFVGDELRVTGSDFPLLSQIIQRPPSPHDKLIVGPSRALTSRKRSVRVAFRNDAGESVEYALLDLKPVRIGTEEAEFICSDDNVPFQLAVVIPISFLGPSTVGDLEVKQGNISFDFQLVGSDVKQAKKFLDAMALLQPKGQIEIFDLQLEKIAFTTEVECGPYSTERLAQRRFVTDVAQVADVFALNLRLPSNVADEDLNSLLILKTFAESGTQDLASISTNLFKTEENQDLPQKLAGGRGVFRFVHPRQEPQPRLFGVDVDTGPCSIEAECEINDLSKSMEEFRRATVGSVVSLSFRPMQPARFFLLTEEQWRNLGGQPLLQRRKD